MVSIDAFRKMALAFNEAEEQPHFEKASFRINKKIFATLNVKAKTAVLKLSEIEQSVFGAYDKTIIYPVNGAWGKQGWTIIELSKVKKEVLMDALKISYKNVAPKFKNKNVCPKGHTFYKSSECPVCPICEKENTPTTGFLSLVSAPARRALEGAGISTLKKLSKKTKKDILALHGIGPSAIPILEKELKSNGLSFLESKKAILKDKKENVKQIIKINLIDKKWKQ